MALFYRQGSRFVVVCNRMVGAAVLQHLGEILAELLTDKLQCCITLLGINVTNNKGECIENGDRTADEAKRKPKGTYRAPTLNYS